MRQSIEDGVTLEIVYEGRTHNAEVTDQQAMDVAFQDVFSDYKITERLQILGYGSLDAYLESKDTIRAKAADMMRHYIEQVFPNGFKAQVVATSREAAVRYKDALDQALNENISELERNNPNLIDIGKLKKLMLTEINARASEHFKDEHHAEQEPTYGLHRVKQMPFFRVFKKEFYGDSELTDDQISVLVNLTQHVFNLLEVELKLKGFWESIPARNRLKANLQELLLSSTFENLPDVFQNRNRIISRIMELAETNNDKILYAA